MSIGFHPIPLNWVAKLFGEISQFNADFSKVEAFSNEVALKNTHAIQTNIIVSIHPKIPTVFFCENVDL